MKVICFDALGTLIDTSHAVEDLNRRYPAKGLEISQLWRAKQIDYSRLRSMANQYKPFDQITRDALKAALTQIGIHANSGELDEIMAEYLRAVAFEDVFNLLNTNDFPWAIVTNANREMIRPMLTNAGILIGDSDLITSDQVQSFKVSPEIYGIAWQWARAHGAAEMTEVLFVSANQWDAIAATWFGFTTCWVNRFDHSPDVLDARPMFEISTLESISQLIGSST